MNSKPWLDKLTAVLGVLALVLFSTKPYILNLIEPAKSIGQVIGENAKDLIESMSGEGDFNSPNSKRAIWSNIITFSAFIFLALTILLAAANFRRGNRYGLIGCVLSVVGLGIYLSNLVVGLIGFIVLAVLVVVLVISISN